LDGAHWADHGGWPLDFRRIQILADLSFVLACFASCCCVFAIVLRFAARRLPAFAGLKCGAYGMYLVHYCLSFGWQYALLGAALPAVIKGRGRLRRNAAAQLGGCVSFRAVDRLRFGHPASRSGRLQDAERYRGSSHVLPTPCCRGNVLAHARSAAQEVSELVVAAAISPRRSGTLQSKHRSTSAFDAAVILLKSVVQIAT
jgi:hypothetical protein